jgi:hypothetical protein
MRRAPSVALAMLWPAIPASKKLAAFDYAINLLAAKPLPEVVELSTPHLRKQFDAPTKQSNDLTAIAQKVANETAEPMKDGITKAFRKVA